MEMPTPCNSCEKLFDLPDGKTSPYNRKIIICAACADKEQAEYDREDEIQELKYKIEDAEYTLKTAKERLLELEAQK